MDDVGGLRGSSLPNKGILEVEQFECTISGATGQDACDVRARDSAHHSDRRAQLFFSHTSDALSDSASFINSRLLRLQTVHNVFGVW